MKTDDKIALTYSRFLTRRRGFNLEAEDLSIRDMVYKRASFRSFLNYTSQNLVMSYLAKARDFCVKMISEKVGHLL